MNYLEKNLNNSLTLPYELMRIIYEYADPFNAIRKQIESKDYKLRDEFYYKDFDYYNTYYDSKYITIQFIRICNLHPYFNGAYRSQMIKDLQLKKDFDYTNGLTTKYINYKNYSTKQIYKLWLKL